MNIRDLLRYWAGYRIHLPTGWIDTLEHLLICKTNQNPDYVCPHKE